MKKLLYLIIPIVLLGCDDGDIITNDFDFEDAAVEACDPTLVSGSINKYVFYKNENTNFESLVMEFQTSEVFLEEDLVVGERIIIDGSTNSFQYRRLDGALGNDYYCNDIPPSSPLVTEVYRALGGTIIVSSGIKMDDDNDGVPSSEEGIIFNEDGTVNDDLSRDLDGDGIPNYKDSDDDGDNVPTNLEGRTISNAGIVQNPNLTTDTDNDGKLDYLDNDDDDDGVLTINEDVNSNLNPTDDTIDVNTVLPNYLINDSSHISVSPSINQYIEHEVTRERQVIISIENLSLSNGSEEIVFELYNLGNYPIPNPETLICTPAFPTPSLPVVACEFE